MVVAKAESSGECDKGFIVTIVHQKNNIGLLYFRIPSGIARFRTTVPAPSRTPAAIER